MTREEAKEVFLNRGFIDGIYDGDKWREACVVISKWLEQEPTTKNDLGVDCISRADVKAKKIYSHERHEYVVPVAEIDWLPSVTPQEPKTGHWVEEKVNGGGRRVFCSECGSAPPFEYVSTGDVYSASGYGVINKTKYCPNCGAKMQEVEDGNK